MTELWLVANLRVMDSIRRQKHFFAPLCLFGSWAFLRFFLMMKIRHFIFQNIDMMTEERILINHGLIVLEAALLFLVFFFFRKTNRVDEFHLLGDRKVAVHYGFIIGLFIFLITIPVALYFGMKYSPQFGAIDAIGNVFSNGAEEVIYRGILFAAAVSIFKSSWVAVVISSVAFGAGHWDLPVLFQAYIVVVGIFLGWTYLRAKSLTAPYVAHMVADLLADSLFH